MLHNAYHQIPKNVSNNNKNTSAEFFCPNRAIFYSIEEWATDQIIYFQLFHGSKNYLQFLFCNQGSSFRIKIPILESQFSPYCLMYFLSLTPKKLADDLQMHFSTRLSPRKQKERRDFFCSSQFSDLHVTQTRTITEKKNIGISGTLLANSTTLTALLTLLKYKLTFQINLVSD